MRLQALSALAESFPSAEVEYEDLLALPFQADGRAGDGGIDCLGIVLEVYRRAGLLLPDPKLGGSTIQAFAGILERIEDPGQLYDLANLRRGEAHLYVVVRPGLFLSSREKIGVHTQRAKTLRGHPQVEFWRVRASCLP